MKIDRIRTKAERVNGLERESMEAMLKLTPCETRKVVVHI
jgi:hypothetical protein